MACLSLSLLGTFEVKLDGEAVTSFESDKVRALLAYLVVEAKQPHRREKLAALLWPEQPEKSARQNLSQALFNLRGVIGDSQADPPYLKITTQMIQFEHASDHWLDAAAFDESLEVCDAHRHTRLVTCAICLKKYERTSELYRGDFLEGFSLVDGQSFNEWALVERERYHRKFCMVLSDLVEGLRLHGQIEGMLEYAQRWVALDPWNEAAHRSVILVQALGGQQGAAMKSYETCRQILKDELGVAPGEEIMELYERIQSGKLQPLEKRAKRLPAFLYETAPEVPPPIFVARQGELARLEAALESAIDGKGSVMFITGDPGQGKTALLNEFSRRALEMKPEVLILHGTCNSYSGNGDPYLPFRQVLGALTADVERDWRVGRVPHKLCLRLWEALPVVAWTLLDYGQDLLKVFLPGKDFFERAQAALSGDEDLARRQGELEESEIEASVKQKQADLLEQYTNVLQRVSEHQPLVLLIDDLQWVDSSSANLLLHLGRQISEEQIMIVGAYRSEEVSMGRGEDRHQLETPLAELKRQYGDVWIDLAQADRESGIEFVEQFVDSEPNHLSPAFRQRLHLRTGGHALFTIELLRELKTRGKLVPDQDGFWVEAPLQDWDILPARVEGVIEERFGRLEKDLRETLSIASVEGEEFTAQVVARIQGIDERKMIGQLSQELQRCHRLVKEHGEVRIGKHIFSHYQFAHPLFQQFIYNNLDAGERRLLHVEIAEAIEELYTGNTEEIVVQLARHYLKGGEEEKALDYLVQAGDRALRLSANVEAVDFYRKGLELLKTMPDTPDHARQELDLHLAILGPLTMIKSQVAPEVEQTLNRARELCQKIGETPPQLVSTLAGLSRFNYNQAKHRKALELAEQALYLASRTQDPELILYALYVMMLPSCVLPEYASAREHQEKMLALYDPQQRHSLILLLGLVDSKVISLSYTSLILGVLGYPDQALDKIHEALAWTRELSHSYTRAACLHLNMVFHFLRRETQTTRKRAEEAIALSTEQDFPTWLALGTTFRGWALIKQGHVEAGMEQIHQGLTALKTLKFGAGMSMYVALLAEGYGEVGQIEAGLAVLGDCFEMVEKSDERFWEAELHRLKGEFLLMQGATESEVEVHFQKAIDVAHQQSAKSLELRAVVSLCRLWQKQGKKEKAHKMLAETYGWFTEGFDTADLKEAKALLDELSLVSSQQTGSF